MCVCVCACVRVCVRAFVSEYCFLSTCVIRTQKYTHAYVYYTLIWYIRESNGTRTHKCIKYMCVEEREDCTSKLKFALFSRGSAIVPACRCYLTPGRRRPPPPPPPVRKTLRLAASGLHYSYKSFLVNIFLCSAAAAAAAALPTFHFCLLLPRLRGRSLPHHHVSSRLVSSSRTPPPPYPLTDIA